MQAEIELVVSGAVAETIEELRLTLVVNRTEESASLILNLVALHTVAGWFHSLFERG